MKKIPLAHEEPEILPREHLAAAVQSKQRHSHLPGGGSQGRGRGAQPSPLPTLSQPLQVPSAHMFIPLLLTIACLVFAVSNKLIKTKKQKIKPHRDFKFNNFYNSI